MASDRDSRTRDADTGKAVRFLAIKAAIFILVPLIVSVIAVLVLLK